jgi:hypothetical protein
MFVAYLALNLFAFLLKGPIGSKSKPPVRDRRGADAVADGEPEPAPIAAAGGSR